MSKHDYTNTKIQNLFYLLSNKINLFIIYINSFIYQESNLSIYFIYKFI